MRRSPLLIPIEGYAASRYHQEARFYEGLRLDSPLHEIDHSQELRALKRARRPVNLTRGLALIILGIIFITAMVFCLSLYSHGVEPLVLAPNFAAAPENSWARQFFNAQLRYREWLSSHGTAGEVGLLDGVASALFREGSDSSGAVREIANASFLSRTYLQLLTGLLQLTFMVVASWRAAVGLLLCGLYFGLRQRSLHIGDDMLGATGNGRLFFSGIRVDLEKVTALGVPDKLVPGLACPKKISLAAARASPIGALLERNAASNQTNLALTAVVEAHSDYPAFVAKVGEESALTRAMQAVTLPQSSVLRLERLFELRNFYASGKFATTAKGELSEVKEPYSAQDYSLLLQASCQRVLTPNMRELIAGLPNALLATLSLAIDAGKVLTFSREGQKWIRKSNFPELCARAVLHSTAAFGHEYTSDERSLVRRALIYGSRTSVLGPIRFPIDLEPAALAMRQWSEVLQASPHDLATVADEVELYGLVVEAHAAWMPKLIHSIVTLDNTFLSSVVAAPPHLIFVPLATLASSLRDVLDRERLTRLEELVALVSQKQRLLEMSGDFNAETGERVRLPAYSRILAPISFAEMKLLSERHNVPIDLVREWSSMRVILDGFGWLARRVGQSSVPESSLVFTVVDAPGAHAANAKGLLGTSAVVPLRATRVAAELSNMWHTRFQCGERAAMAETREEFERLLQGLALSTPEEVST